MPRRTPGTLVPLESDILEVTLSMLRAGDAEVHGFGLARAMQEQDGGRALTSHGTLYKALGRLEELGLLTSRWEDPAAVEGRPRRRLYGLSERGLHVAEQARARGAADRAAGRALPIKPQLGTAFA